MGSVAGAATKTGKNLLFGKKDPGVAGRFLEQDPVLAGKLEIIRKRQELTGREFEKELNQLTDDNIKKQLQTEVAEQRRGLARAGRDAKLQARDALARRGMDRSAAGLNALVNADQPFREQAARLGTNIPAEIRRRRMQGLMGITQGLGGLMTDPGDQRTYIQGRESRGRGGGLFNVAATLGGAALGAKMGGPQGMGAGAQAGGGLASSFGGAFG